MRITELYILAQEMSQIAFQFSTSSSILRLKSISTSLYTSRPTTFGQLAFPDIASSSSTMSTPFSTPSCPCCAFLTTNGALFLPWNTEEDDGEANKCVAIEGTSLSAEDIMTPNEAWDRIRIPMSSSVVDSNDERQQILLVDTHGHPHLQRDVQYAKNIQYAENDTSIPIDDQSIVSLTCAVSPLDWNSALEYASQSQQILPALGIHPWYLADILVDETKNIDMQEDITKYIKWDWLSELEAHLSNHPHLLVGEIGMCKMARFVREFPKEKGGKATALQLQKIVFKKQLDLAAKWSRPVTVHCVNAHGLFIEVMRDTLTEVKESCAEIDDITEAKRHWRRAFPPAIGMHSFTGTAHHVGEILAFEKEILYPEEVQASGKRRRRKKQQGADKEEIQQPQDSEKDILFYFGFSHAVNHVMCTSEKARKKGSEAVRSIPSDRLLVELDVHNSVDVILGTAGAAAYAAQVKGESLEQVARSTTKNGLRFLSSLDSITDT